MLLRCIVLFTLLSNAYACGPWLPEAYVLRNDDLFYAPPEIGFAAELTQLLPTTVPHKAQFPTSNTTLTSATEELEETLIQLDYSVTKRSQLIDQYTDFRSQLNDIKSTLSTLSTDYHRRANTESQIDKAYATLNSLQVPQQLPLEFELYLNGALAYHKKETDTARSYWMQLLKLPKDERPYRTVHAAFMLAKTSPTNDPHSFSKVRVYANTGFKDSQGLAAASYGLEARCYLDRDQYEPAIRLYLDQWTAGYPNAALSLKIVARSAWNRHSKGDLKPLASNPTTRAVMTAYLLDQGYDKQNTRWLEALPDANEITVPEAGRFALMEYQMNHLSAARLWLDYASPSDALALWVRSKLLLRQGKIDEGRTLLQALTRQIETNDQIDWRQIDTDLVWVELGLLQLNEEQYLEAATSFDHAHSWHDLAYILERVLSTEELIQWAEHRKTKHTDEAKDKVSAPRALIARRLMREQHFEKALDYFSPENRKLAQRYIDAMRAASDTSRSATDRAQHYWDAALLSRKHGIDLFATELSPDYAWMDGYFDWPDLTPQRIENRYLDNYTINQPQREELKRLKKTTVYPEKRFHYRYRAAELALLAASLLPNNDLNASRIYSIAGSWLKLRDPEAANLYYKQLVIRCPNTELGKAAQELNWLPKGPIDEPFTTQ